MHTRLSQVTALLLRSREYGEGNRLFTVLSREDGKLLVVARGVKKPRAKLAGALQQFALLELQLAAGRRFDVVTQARVLEPFYDLRNQLEAFAYASYFAEMFDAALEERQPHPALFDLLTDALHRLTGDESPDLLARYVEINLAAMLGFQPQLAHCVQCRAPLAGRDTEGRALWPTWLGFTAQHGGALCPTCTPVVPGARRVAAGTVQVARLLLSGGTQALNGLRLSEGLRREMELTFRDYLEYRLECRLQSSRFLHECAGAHSAGTAGQDEPCMI